MKFLELGFQIENNTLYSLIKKVLITLKYGGGRLEFGNIVVMFDVVIKLHYFKLGFMNLVFAHIN